MNTHTPITLDSKPVLTWDAPSRPTVERTKRWYVIAAVVVAVVVVYAVVTASWTLAVVSVLAGGMYYLVHDHAPGVSHIELHDSGVLYDGEFTRWDQFVGFWFVPTPGYVELRFVPKRGAKRVVIQLGTLDPAQLRMILGQRIPELVHKRESMIDIFIRICKL